MDGLRIGVTASRRAEQLAAALRRKGATTIVGSTLGGDEPESDDALAGATDEVVAAHPDWFVATTGMGMKLWVEAAERTGRLDRLRSTVSAARRVARGAKAVGGLRRIDADPEWVSPEQTDADVVRWLREHLDADDVVAVQLHGSPTQHPYGDLAETATVVTVTPYRSVLPEDREPARALVRRTIAGDVDVMTFTSPSAVRGLFEIAGEMGDGTRAALLDRLQGDVVVAAVGPVTGDAVEHAGVPVGIRPERPRTADLVRAIADWA